jgi:curli production assembly/transport component CsgF
MRKYYWAIPAMVMFVAHAPATAFASEMVYHPVIPAFGGNPLNGAALLSTAQAQGEGVKSGSQGPDLSGLNNALNNIGSSPIVVVGPGSGGTTTGGGAGSGGTTPTPNAVRATVP